MDNKKEKGFEVCFLKEFVTAFKKSFCNTDEEKLKAHIKEKSIKAIEELNKIGNKLKVKKVYITVDNENTELISIDIDRGMKYSKDHEIVFLQVSPTILRKDVFGGIECLFPNKENLLEVIKKIEEEEKKEEEEKVIKNLWEKNPFSIPILCHEFGHLQDCQREGFKYTKEDEELHDCIDKVWNVFLDRRISNLRNVNREKIENYFYRDAGKSRNCYEKLFKEMWDGYKEDYSFWEIKNYARKLKECEKPTI